MFRLENCEKVCRAVKYTVRVGTSKTFFFQKYSLASYQESQRKYKVIFLKVPFFLLLFLQIDSLLPAHPVLTVGIDHDVELRVAFNLALEDVVEDLGDDVAGLRGQPQLGRGEGHADGGPVGAPVHDGHDPGGCTVSPHRLHVLQEDVDLRLLKRRRNKKLRLYMGGIKETELERLWLTRYIYYYIIIYCKK